MCLAIPGKVEKITGPMDDTFRTGLVSFGAIRKEINLAMVPEAKVGDYVLVHVGVAISIVDEDEANQTFELLQKMGETDELNSQQ